MDIGTIQVMKVIEVEPSHYLLEKGIIKSPLPKSEATRSLQVGELIEVFILKHYVTMHLPDFQVGEYEWVTVKKAETDKVLVDIGTTELIEISSRDLPAFRTVWPQEGDRLYVVLKQKRTGMLFAVPAKEREFAHLIEDGSHLELNDRISGHVIRTAREGTVMLSEEGYRGFIHRTERGEEPRLGEKIKGRIIEVKEDGTLNVSLKPMRHERLETDAETILHYIKTHDGVIPFSDNSSPEEIRATFKMSKGAFKRALGRLMRQQKIEQRDGKTFLIKNE